MASQHTHSNGVAMFSRSHKDQPSQDANQTASWMLSSGPACRRRPVTPCRVRTCLCRRSSTASRGHVEEVATALGDEMVAHGVATRNPASRGMLGRRGSWLSSDGERLKREAASFKHYLAKVESKQLANDQSEGFVGGYLA